MSDENKDLSFLVEELTQKNLEYEKLVAEYEEALLGSEQRNQQYRKMIASFSSSKSGLLGILSKQVSDKVNLSMDNFAIQYDKEKTDFKAGVLKRTADELRESSKLTKANQQKGNNARSKKNKIFWDDYRVEYLRYLEEHPEATPPQARYYIGNKIVSDGGPKFNRSTLETQLTKYCEKNPKKQD